MRDNLDDIPGIIHKIQAAGHVVIQPYYDKKFGPLRREAVADVVPDGVPLTFIHNLLFKGLMPDAINARSADLSLMLGLTSRVLVRGYLDDVPDAEILRRFLDQDGIAIANKWDNSLNNLRTREVEVDIPMVDEIEALSTQTRLFHTFNHPNNVLIAGYAEKIVLKVLGRKVDIRPSDFDDDLIGEGHWPVLPAVAKEMRLPYSSTDFGVMTGSGVDIIETEEMVLGYIERLKKDRVEIPDEVKKLIKIDADRSEKAAPRPTKGKPHRRMPTADKNDRKTTADPETGQTAAIGSVELSFSDLQRVAIGLRMAGLIEGNNDEPDHAEDLRKTRRLIRILRARGFNLVKV